MKTRTSPGAKTNNPVHQHSFKNDEAFSASRMTSFSNQVQEFATRPEAARRAGSQAVHKTLKNRKPKVTQDQIFFNSLKDQFRTKDAFLRFN